MRCCTDGLVFGVAVIGFPLLAAGLQKWIVTKSRVLEFGKDTDWCGPITQCGHLHTLCDFPDEKPSADCQNYKYYNMTSKDKLMILHFLNYRRNLAAGGKEYRLPAAAGMRMLQWDDTLADFAQRWVNQCIFHPSVLKDFRPLTDFCRDHPSYRVVQVGMVVLGSRQYGGDWSIMDLVNFLVNWISSDGENVANHVLHSGYIPVEDDGAVLFYAPGYKIGCGSAAFDVYSTNSTYYDRVASLICNLGPVEDLYLQDRYYLAGPPCSACPAGSRCDPNSNFKYLCQSSEILETYIDEADFDGDEDRDRQVENVPHSGYFDYFF